MVVQIIVFLISLIPCVFYYYFLKRLKGDNTEYKKDCRKSLVKGLGSAVPVFLLDLVINILLGLIGISDTASPVVNTLIRCFVVNAFVEELVKVWIGKKTIKKNHDTVSWLDMIAFIAISSIGFEITESIVYIFSSSPGQLLVRGLSVMHLSFGLIEGWYNGKYASTGQKIYSVLSLAVSMLIHGTYNFGLSDEAPEILGVLSLIFAAASLVYWIYMIFWIRKRKDDPVYSSPIYGEAPAEEPAAAEE